MYILSTSYDIGNNQRMRMSVLIIIAGRYDIMRRGKIRNEMMIVALR
jgi:hypothetical protein